jgi:N-methylhydantoinase B
MTYRALDPVTFEVIWHRLLDITEEMGIKYMRTSGSPVLVGAYDASTGIALADGRLVAMGPYITTQGHVLRLIIESVMRLRGPRERFRPGDMYICNDPYLGATHQPDVATVAPVFDRGELSAWVGSSGHWLDIGGPEAGGFTMSASSVFDEGLRMPPTQLVEGGQIREEIVDLIMSQLREPLAELDLRGQIVSNQWGAMRMGELYGEYGSETITQVMEEALDHVRRRLRRRLRELPDGVWREVQYLDHDGHAPNLRQIVCTVTKRGERLTLDFTGSASEVAGFANCSYSGLRAACVSAVCISLGYDMPWNDGVADAVEIVVPRRTVVSAEFPTPVSLATISAIIVTLNLVLSALSRILLCAPAYRDEAMACWCGTSLGVSIAGVNDRGLPTVMAEASHFAAGCGARSYADGVDTGGIIINTTANIPSIEQTEIEYPVMYAFREQVTDSGGPGRWRGGLSAAVAMSPHGGSGHETSFAGVGSEVPNGLGIAGGLPGATVRYSRHDSRDFASAVAEGLFTPGPGTRPLNTPHSPLPRDIIEYHNWQGGGGYGDPIDRDPKDVARDVRYGAVSKEAARDVYGVILDGTGGVDPASTSERRDHVRASRKQRSRPARDVLIQDELWSQAVAWLADEAAAGQTSYAESVTFDFTNGKSSCARCRTDLANARDDFRLGCLVEDSHPHAIGPSRGEDYDRGDVVLRRYYCPTCLVQLEAEVWVTGQPRSAFALAGAGTSIDD